MIGVNAFKVDKAQRDSRVGWSPDREIAKRIRWALYIAAAPPGGWKFEVKRQVTCSANTPDLTLEALSPETTMFTWNIRATTSCSDRYEVTVYYEGTRMPSFNTELLNQAATVYSGFVRNPARRRLAMAALPNGMALDRLPPEVAAGLLSALDLDPKVPIGIVLRGLTVEGELLEVPALGYVATRPHKARLRANIEALKPDILAKLRLLLAGVEKKGVDGQERELTLIRHTETGLQEADLPRLQEQVPGIVFPCEEGAMVYGPMYEAAKTIVASLGEKNSLPPDALVAAEQRLTLAIAERVRLVEEHARITATHPDLETKLEETAQRCQRLEAELAAARQELQADTQTFEDKAALLAKTQAAIDAADTAAYEAMEEQDAIKERQAEAKRLEIKAIEAAAEAEMDAYFATVSGKTGIPVGRLREIANRAP